MSGEGKVGHLPPEAGEEASEVPPVSQLLDPGFVRSRPPGLPRVSEVEVVRHYTRLGQQNLAVDLGFYPLGSCTMKYNPKINERIARHPGLTELHPLQDQSCVQGILRIMYELAEFLCEITGMDKFSLQPPAGASAEYVGVLIMRAYHRQRGELESRTEILIPDTAHGSNLASASMGGFTVKVVPTDREGCVDMEALSSLVSRRTAGLMLTNPNTLGIFERNILEISRVVHESGGLLYYDGANLNAILGHVRPGDMGFDMVHLNLHKTFSTPHGGGGPGAGPLGVKKELEAFLPVPTVEFDGSQYYLDYDRPLSIGRIRPFYGNVPVLLRAYAYILSMGAEGLRRVAQLSVLHSNYVMRKMLESGGFTLPYSPEKPRKHEFVVSASPLLQSQGVTAGHVAKRLLDHGIHAPTMYFPPIVPEALMVEPTETVSKEELDGFIQAVARVVEEARTSPERVREAPTQVASTKVDEVKASHPRTLCVTYRKYVELYTPHNAK